MHNSVNNICKGFISLGLALAAFCTNAQSNLPTTQTQATAPSLLVDAPPVAYPANMPLNYVRTWDAMGPWTNAATFTTQGNSEVKHTTTYVDGLGRPLQTVARQMSPAGKDIVSPFVYDEFGRESNKYMLYTSEATDGNFKQDPFSDQQTFLQGKYPGEQVFYNKTEFEASPLNRITKVMAQGNGWAGSGRGVEMKYLVNTAADGVQIWHINNIIAPETGSTDTYPEGQLYKNVTVDEAGHVLVEYKDKDGLVILKKVQIKDNIPADYSGTDDKWLMTYYIYDDLNRLSFVLSPKAVAQLRDHYNWQLTTGGTANAVLEELCYQYNYNYRSRMIAKKVPGADWVYMIYDQRNRLVFTQDGNMRQRNQWLARLYDDLNRPVMTGMIVYTGGAAALQAYVSGNNAGTTTVPVTGNEPAVTGPDITINSLQVGTKLYQAGNSITWTDGFATDATTDLTAEIAATSSTGTSFTNDIGINNNPVPPTTTLIPLTLSYYDNYSAGNKTYITTYNSSLSAGNNLHVEANPTQAEQALAGTVGMATIIRVRTLPDPSDLAAGIWLTTTNFYDKKGRVIQSQYNNYKGGTDVTTNLYDFTGKTLCSLQQHNNPQNSDAALQNIVVRTRMDYDNSGRLLKIYKAINQNYAMEKLITENIYDEAGKLATKKLGVPGNDLGKLDYTYNIRGWLQGINKTYSTQGSGSLRAFGVELNYDWGFTNNQYSGNIAGTKWRSMGDGKQRAYGFGYDAANRLLFADFKQNSGSNWDNSEGIDFTSYMGNGIAPTDAYDENGNILKMKQWGLQVNSSAIIDDLTYTYTNNNLSNKLQNVIDGVNATDTKLGDFRTSAHSPNASIKGINDPTTIFDYSYDLNGNMVKDLNKDIAVSTDNGITYNYLNLPTHIAISPGSEIKGTIDYVYDAAGNKLEKKVNEYAGFRTGGAEKITSTVYLGEFTYQDNSLQFFAQEEGRVRAKHLPDGTLSFVYDFFIKDHLGNVRSMLTDEQLINKYPTASLEPSKVETEKTYYDIQDANIVDRSAATGITDYTNDNGIGNNPDDPTFEAANSTKLYKLHSDHAKTGLGITLKVMAGDVIDVFGKSYYFQNNPGSSYNNNIPIIDLLNAFLNTPSSAAATAGHGVLTGALINTPTGTTGINGLMSGQDNANNTAPLKPRAFINVIFFDEQFKAVCFKTSIVGAQDVVYDHTDLHNLPVTQNGYVYIYCSNETPVNVFFDNLQVVHTPGPLLEETHYYPFGLTMGGISSKAARKTESNKKFQGQELAHREFSDGSGLETYEFKHRMDDPQIGRFWQVDPLASKYVYNSPYAFSENQVTISVELDGLEKVDINSSTIANNAAQGAAGETFVRSRIQLDENLTVFQRVTTRPAGTTASSNTANDFLIFNSRDGKFYKVEVKTGPTSRISINQTTTDNSIGIGELQEMRSASSKTESLVKTGQKFDMGGSITIRVDPETGEVTVIKSVNNPKVAGSKTGLGYVENAIKNPKNQAEVNTVANTNNGVSEIPVEAQTPTEIPEAPTEVPETPTEFPQTPTEFPTEIPEILPLPL